MKKIGIIALAIALVFCHSAYISAFAQGEAVNLVLSCSGDARVGEIITVKITITKPTVNLAGLEFTLKYNSAHVTPTVTSNGEETLEMNSLVKTIPANWEQMCNHSSAESAYYFRFAISENGTNYLNTAQGLVLEIPFRVKKAGVFEFAADSADVIAIGADSGFSVYGGKGATVSVAAASEAEKFAVELGESGVAQTNGLYYLNAEITNLGDTEGIIGFEFALEYDKNLFKPYITANDNNQMDVFMVSTPQSSWEQLCTHYADKNKYILRFAALHAESLTQSEILKKGEALKISVPFYVIGTEGSVGSFKVNTASVIGLNNKNGFIVGLGDSKTVSIEQGTSSIPSGLYDIVDGYLMYVKAKTSVADFLKPFTGFYLTDDGKKIESGNVATGDVLTNGGGYNLTVVVKGDINENGNIDARDYLLAKRAYFGTFTLDKASEYASDINGNGKLDARDYLLLKRAYFGTYNM